MSFFSISEFAKAIGVAETTLRKWDKDGKLIPHHRMPGGKRVYSSEQVDDYFAGRWGNKCSDSAD